MPTLPQQVERDFLVPHGLTPHRRIRTGLSQSQVWHCLGTGPNGQRTEFCLRGWPEQTEVSRLRAIHFAVEITRRQGCSYLPTYFRGPTGEVYVRGGNRYWELTEWKPGIANYTAAPTLDKLRAAMHAVAELHQIWAKHDAAHAPSPAVARRVELLSKALSAADVWRHRVNAQALGLTAYHRQLANDTLEALQRSGADFLMKLEVIRSVKVPVHFVLRDIHAEHVLYEQDRVSGILDLGAANSDEVATDLARLVGSLEPHDAGRRALALDYYEEAVEYSIDQERVALLDASSTLLSAIQWLKWLVLEQREFDCPNQVLMHRWRGFLDRLQGDQLG